MLQGACLAREVRYRMRHTHLDPEFARRHLERFTFDTIVVVACCECEHFGLVFGFRVVEFAHMLQGFFFRTLAAWLTVMPAI